MPQVVFARPSWASTENSYCTVRLNSSLADDVAVKTGAVYIKAVMDHKYDGIQVRDLTVSMVRRRLDGDQTVDVLREAMLHLPVNRCIFYVYVKKGRALVIAPLSRHCHRRGAQVHGALQAASHIPALYLPSRSRYLPTPDEPREDGGLSKPRPRVQRATGPLLLRDRPQPAGLEPTTNQRPRGL